MRKLWMIAVVLVSSSAGAANKYSLADLEALEKGESWNELVEHLGDVSPADRDARWERMAEKAAVGALTQLHSKEQPFAALGLAEQLAGRYPSLKKSKAFQQARAEVGLKGLEACYDLGWVDKDCNKRFLAFAKGDGELAFGAGKIVIKKQFAYFAVPFFRESLGGKPDAKRCDDSELQRATIAGLGLPADDAKAGDARAIAELCFAEMRESLEVRAEEDSGGYEHTNSCKVLASKKALKGALAKRCAG